MLNAHACAVEDRLAITQQALANLVLADQYAIGKLGPHLQRYAKMEAILTDPNKLAIYYQELERQMAPESYNQAVAIHQAGVGALQGQGQVQLPQAGSFVGEGQFYQGTPEQAGIAGMAVPLQVQQQVRPQALPAHPPQRRAGAGLDLSQVKPWETWKFLDGLVDSGRHREMVLVHQR